MADDAAGVVAADVERGGDGAVLNQVGAVGKAHKTTGVVTGRGDGASHFQVLDGGVLDIVERGHALLVDTGAGGRADDVGSDGVAATEERAAEGFVAAQAHHVGDADVGSQHHVLAAVVVGAVADIIGESKPIVGTADDVRGTLRAFTAKIVNGSDKWHNLLSTEVVGCGNNGHAFHNELLSIGKGDAV